MNTISKQAENLKFLCLGISYAFSFAYINMFFMKLPAYGYTIYLSVLALAAILWLELTRKQLALTGRLPEGSFHRTELRFWESILVLLCINTYFGQLPGLSFFFVHMVLIYLALVGTGHLLTDHSSCLLPLDLINGIFRLPFMNLFARILTFSERNKADSVSSEDGETGASGKPKRNIAGTLAVLAVVVLIFGMAFHNLAMVDNNFSRALNSLNLFLLHLSFEEIVFKILLSIPIGMYLFGLFQGCVRRDRSEEKDFHEDLVERAVKARFVPDLVFSIVLSVFILVYLLFYISQAGYMFSAFAGVLPEAFTASEYAVSGFNELINVVLINFVLMSLLRIFGSHEDRLIRCQSVILMVESMIFACISASKIILYMSRFGYTSSRTLGLWGTIVVFTGSALTIVHLLTKKRTFAIWLSFAAASYVIMNFAAWPFLRISV